MCSSFPSAPTFLHYEVQPVSDTRILISWSIDSSKSGILDFYRLNCVDPHGVRVGPSTILTWSYSIRVDDLQPNTTYNCILTASAVAEPGQNPDDCKTSVTLPPIRTHLHCKSLLNLRYTTLTITR